MEYLVEYLTDCISLALGFQHRMIPGGCSASKKYINLGTRFEWYFADCFRIEKYEPSIVPFKTIYGRSTDLDMSLSSIESGSLAKDKEVLDYCTLEVNVR